MWQMIKVYGTNGALPFVNIEAWNTDEASLEIVLNETLKSVVETFMRSGWEPFSVDYHSSTFYLKKFVQVEANE